MIRNENIYNDYKPSMEELKLIKKIESQKIESYFFFTNKETIEKILPEFIEYKTGARLKVDYKNCIIRIEKQF